MSCIQIESILHLSNSSLDNIVLSQKLVRNCWLNVLKESKHIEKIKKAMRFIKEFNYRKGKKDKPIF